MIDLKRKFGCQIELPDRLVKQRHARALARCTYCNNESQTWCLGCKSALCSAHIYPRLSPYPYRHVFLYDGDRVYCRECQPKDLPEGYL